MYKRQLFAILTKADTLVIQSQNALYTGNPEDAESEYIPYVSKIGAYHEGIAGGAYSQHSNGGMIGKIKAIKLATMFGINCAIMKATEPNCTQRALEGDPTIESTIFVAQNYNETEQQGALHAALNWQAA